ncbi:MAG: hypothetical protein ABIL53_03735 [candidate division WOR-3 bacterium]
MIGLILVAAPVVRVQNYAIVGRVSPKGAISQMNKRIDVGTYTPSRGNGIVPFLFTEVYLDTAPNQYTLWGNSHRSLYRNGDTIGVAFRRVEALGGSGRIGAAWSFDGGMTWSVRGNINYDAGLADMGGRYPNFVGFTTSGFPVVAWPELLPGPAWGKSCIAFIDGSGTPRGVCSDRTPSGDSVYHNFAWMVAPDTFAVVGFTTGDGIVGFLFDVATNSIIPGSEVKLRDPAILEDVSIYDISLKGDTLYVMGTNAGLGEGDGVVKIFYDGTGLATDPLPPSQGGSNVVESHIFCCWVITIGSNTFDNLGDVAYSFTIDRYGRGWSVYAMKDTSVDPGSGPGHIIVMHRWDDSRLVIFAPWNGGNVETRNPVYWPRLAVDETDSNKLAVFWIQYLDTLNYGCATGTHPFAKSIFYAATSDGGTTWGINIVTNPTDLADFFFPARDAGADYTFSGGLITGVYLTPRDATTDIYCNAVANGVIGSYLHVVTDTISYTSNYPGDTTIIVSVNERTNEVTKLAVFRNGVFINGSAAIYDVKGSLVRNVEGSQFIRLNKGAYFIRVNGRVYKVVIR